MKQISITNPFLQNILFLKDVYKFSLIGHNLGLDETQIYSDEESYRDFPKIKVTITE